LKKQWYLYLEGFGFDDLEKNERNLDSKCSAQIAGYINFTEKILFDATFNYHQWVREKLEKNQFRSDTDRFIWEYHAEGMSRREMAPRIGLNDRWVGRKIETIEGYLKDKIFTTSSGSISILSQAL
jgi:hypothetical protein